MWIGPPRQRAGLSRRIPKPASKQRLSWLHKIIEGFRARLPELARMMTLEMGAPITFATQRQATVALFHFEEAARVLASYTFEERMGNGIVRREPIGVCGLITPWNWPLNQVASKVAPALATGCTVVLKPSEIAPLSAMLLAEIVDDADSRRASSISSTATDPRWARRSPPTPRSTWCRSPDRQRPA